MDKLLLHFDTDAVPGTFDAVVAYDGGADRLAQYGGVSADNCGKLTEGAIYTRAPADKKNTAIFISGGDLDAGQRLLDAVTGAFFDRFRVSVMLDSGGCNTTAAAGVALLASQYDIAGKTAAVLAGTGPVGQRAAVMLAASGARRVVLTSRSLERAEQACALMQQRFGAALEARQCRDAAETAAALDGAQIAFGAGKTGVQLLGLPQWRDLAALEAVVDVNTRPPAGIEGVEVTDGATRRHGTIAFGGLCVGALKLKLHRACIAALFQTNDQVLDAPAILNLARSLAD